MRTYFRILGHFFGAGHAGAGGQIGVGQTGAGQAGQTGQDWEEEDGLVGEWESEDVVEERDRDGRGSEGECTGSEASEDRSAMASIADNPERGEDVEGDTEVEDTDGGGYGGAGAIGEDFFLFLYSLGSKLIVVFTVNSSFFPFVLEILNCLPCSNAPLSSSPSSIKPGLERVESVG